MADNTGKQVNALTSTRAIAAIMVVIHHFGSEVFPFRQGGKLFNSGNVAISYFFVLSGFVLYITYCDRNTGYWEYLKKRARRILPLYMLALVLSACINLFFYRQFFTTVDFISEVVVNVLLVQAFIPPYALTINAAAWTISVEMFFYLLFPVVLILQKRKIAVFILLTLLLFAASQFVQLKYYPVLGTLDTWWWNNVLFHPFIHFSQFLIGMVGGYLYMERKLQTARIRFLPLVMFIIVLLAIVYRPDSISYQVGFIAPLFMLLILFIANANPVILNNRALVYLGEISYGIYILQFPVQRFMYEMNIKYLHISEPYFFYFIFIVLVLFASLTHHFIERPLTKKRTQPVKVTPS